MNAHKRLNEIYASAETIPFDNTSKIVLMSDCHRGDGSWADSYLKNESTCYAALEHYFDNGYTYIEIGDGDELWENKRLSSIITVHKDVFSLINAFYEDERYFMIYGNHDHAKKNYRKRRNRMFTYYDVPSKTCEKLFDGIQTYEGLILQHKETGKKVFLVHGHQVDFLNSALWKLARFLVRYIWRPLERFGLNDPTSAAKNYNKKETVERKLINWVRNKDCILIAGHTHRPVFPDTTEPRYFNDGSCVHPGCVTAIEIEQGTLTLVRWCVKSRPDGILFIGKEVLAGPENIADYFKNKVNRGNSIDHSCKV